MNNESENQRKLTELDLRICFSLTEEKVKEIQSQEENKNTLIDEFSKIKEVIKNVPKEKFKVQLFDKLANNYYSFNNKEEVNKNNNNNNNNKNKVNVVDCLGYDSLYRMFNTYYSHNNYPQTNRNSFKDPAISNKIKEALILKKKRFTIHDNNKMKGKKFYPTLKVINFKK